MKTSSCPRPPHAVARRIRAKDTSLEALHDLTCLALCVARMGNARRTAPVLSFIKAVYDIGGDAKLQSRCSGNVGAAECLLGRLDLGLRRHVGMLKSSMVQSDWTSMALCLANLKPGYAAHAGGARHVVLCEQAASAMSQGPTAFWEASARLIALPAPERPMSTPGRAGAAGMWGIEEVGTAEQDEAPVEAAASPPGGTAGGGKSGQLKQRVGILNTWKDRRVHLSGLAAPP